MRTQQHPHDESELNEDMQPKRGGCDEGGLGQLKKPEEPKGVTVPIAHVARSADSGGGPMARASGRRNVAREVPRDRHPRDSER